MNLFNELLKLHSHNEFRTPLEDFTTEILAGVLNSNPDIKREFTRDFLKLKEDDYTIRTQSRHHHEVYGMCIIDLEIEGEDTICFVENKVNSTEGYEQLKKYSSVLDKYCEKKSNTHLIYCTKYLDEKSNADHNFKQKRWFEVAEFFQRFKEDSLVKYFLEFLKTNDMAQELTLKAEDFIVFANIKNTMNFVNECMERSKSGFEKHFGGNRKIINGVSLEQMLRGRLIYWYKDVLDGGGLSEIKYGFRINQPFIFVDIYVGEKNLQYKDFLEAFQGTPHPFVHNKYTPGTSVALIYDISTLLNQGEAISKIDKWFNDSFVKFKEIINNSPNLNWQIDNQKA